MLGGLQQGIFPDPFSLEPQKPRPRVAVSLRPEAAQPRPHPSPRIGCGKPEGTYTSQLREEQRLREASPPARGTLGGAGSDRPAIAQARLTVQRALVPTLAALGPLLPPPRPASSLSTWAGPLLTAPSRYPLPLAVSLDAPLPQGQACLTVSTSTRPGGWDGPHPECTGGCCLVGQVDGQTDAADGRRGPGEVG